MGSTHEAVLGILTLDPKLDLPGPFLTPLTGILCIALKLCSRVYEWMILIPLEKKDPEMELAVERISVSSGLKLITRGFSTVSLRVRKAMQEALWGLSCPSSCLQVM